MLTSSLPAIRICQPGYDVHTCPDWAYLFNSDWPNLAIANEQTAIQSAGGGTLTLTHDLMFSPLCFVWASYNGNNYCRIPGASIEVNKTQVFITYSLSVPLKLTVRCYNVDISKEAHYNLPQSAQAKMAYNSQFGGKIAKSGKLIYSNNLNDFIMHTRAQSPAVLDVCTETGKYFSGGSIVYPLRTSYLPWFAAFANNGGGNYNMLNTNDVTLQTINGKQSLVVNLVATLAGTLLVMRDPLFYPNTLRVVY